MNEIVFCSAGANGAIHAVIRV